MALHSSSGLVNGICIRVLEMVSEVRAGGGAATGRSGSPSRGGIQRERFRRPRGEWVIATKRGWFIGCSLEVRHPPPAAALSCVLRSLPQAVSLSRSLPPEAFYNPLISEKMDVHDHYTAWRQAQVREASPRMYCV